MKWISNKLLINKINCVDKGKFITFLDDRAFQVDEVEN